MSKHRKSSMRQWAIFCAIAIALFALLASVWFYLHPGSSLLHISPIQSDTTVTVGLRQAPDSLDIRKEDGSSIDQALLGNVYETLVTTNEENKIEPGLAQSWKVSADGLNYHFTLSSGIHFSNGQSLTSDDVVWSIKQTVEKQYQGASELANLTAVSNDSQNTVKIVLGQPNPTLLRALSGRAGIVYDSQAKIDYAKTAVGSGPFTVSNFNSGKSIVLKRNDSYWGQKAASSQVTLRYFTSDTSMSRSLKNDEIQMALPDPMNSTSKMFNDPDQKIENGQTASKVLLAYNSNQDSIFSDEHVRQGVRYIIDAASIASSQADSAGALGGPISPLEPGYEDLTSAFPFDVSKGRSLLSYFGRGYVGTLNFLVPEQYQALGENITQQLRSNGYLTVNMQVVDEQTLRDRTAKGDFTIALITMDQTGDAGQFVNPDSIFHYQNGSAQQFYQRASEATNDADYQKNLQDFARTLSSDAASDWLYIRKSTVVVKSKLMGYPKNMTDQRLPLARVAMQ